MGQEQLPICIECGGHGEIAVHEYVEKTHYYESLDCKCGKAGVAADRIYDKFKRYRQVGDLRQDHLVQWRTDQPELIEEWEEDWQTDDEGVDDIESCADCFTTASLEDWERREWEPKMRPEDDRYYVYCANCYEKNRTKDDR